MIVIPEGNETQTKLRAKCGQGQCSLDRTEYSYNMDTIRRANGARQAQDLTVGNVAEQ